MLSKKHKTRDGKLILAVCDSELIGKKFTQGKLQIDLTTDFYKGEEKSESEILLIFQQAYILNLVGEKTVKLALKQKLIDETHILKIQGIPHAQCVIVREE
ncbi:DUF424 family protein [Candidatus Woesearchaeota archaeon]|nr:DUF424 family protein [Candidatus Woesearchaeota archaeon]